MATTPGRTGSTTDPADTEPASAWITVGAAFMSMTVVFGVAYSFGAFFGPMAAEFGAGSGATSVVFGITAFCWFTLGSVTGRLADRYGPRPVLLVGAVSLTVGLLVTSTVTQLWQGYLSYGLGVGIAVACGYVPMVAAVGGWFDRRRALALAVAVAGIGVGTLVGAPVAAALIQVHGWRATHVILGIAGGILLLVCALAARRPPAPQGEATRSARTLVGTPAFRWMYLATLLATLALFVPFVYLPAFAGSIGLGPVAGAALIGVIGVASVIGRLAIGAVADRVGRFTAFQGSFAALAVSFLIWLVAGSQPLLVVFALVLGAGYGGWIALQPTVIAELFGMNGLGGVVGLVYTAGGIGALAGPPLAGLLIDGTGGYGWAITAAAVCALGAFLALLPLARADVRPTEQR